MATTKKEQVKMLWEQSFGRGAWTDWFFDSVFDDSESMVLTEQGQVLSTLLLQKRRFRFCGHDMAMAYIAGATTARKERGRGLMGKLMIQALREAYARGDAFCSLIPASRHLYFYYDRFGFATVFYVNEERYTSVHLFEHTVDTEQGDFKPEDLSSHAANVVAFKEVQPDFHAYSEVIKGQDYIVVHSEPQWQRILEDAALDGGKVYAVSDGKGYALATAVFGNDVVSVRSLLATKDYEYATEARNTVLAKIAAAYPDKSLTVWTLPATSDNSPRLRSRGMMRIVDAHAVLQAIASQHPDIKQVVRVYDSILPQNNGYYILNGGECSHVESTMRRVTLDVTVTTLTKILFSSAKMAEVFNFPGARPYIDLMLD